MKAKVGLICECEGREIFQAYTVECKFSWELVLSYSQDNYERDPSLSWQYFGSSTGFLRQYPAIKWLTYEDDPDMYDARMRDWYIKSAASPKAGLATKNPPKKPQQMGFWGFFKFLIFYENNTNFLFETNFLWTNKT